MMGEALGHVSCPTTGSRGVLGFKAALALWSLCVQIIHGKYN